MYVIPSGHAQPSLQPRFPACYLLLLLHISVSAAFLNTCCLQLMIATKRLSTTFGDREAPMGAEGSFQDLTRFIIAAAYSHAMHKGRVQNVKPTDKVSWDSHNYSPGTAVQGFSKLCRVYMHQSFLPHAELDCTMAGDWKFSACLIEAITRCCRQCHIRVRQFGSPPHLTLCV